MIRICLVGYASQPDIQFVCDDAWSTPAWGNAETGIEGVYIADGGRWYTFEPTKLQCPGCLAKTEKKP